MKETVAFIFGLLTHAWSIIGILVVFLISLWTYGDEVKARRYWKGLIEKQERDPGPKVHHVKYLILLIFCILVDAGITYSLMVNIL